MTINEKSNMVEPNPTVRTHIITALYIMDEKGRGVPLKKGEGNMLWQKDWDNLRSALIDALFLLSET